MVSRFNVAKCVGYSICMSCTAAIMYQDVRPYDNKYRDAAWGGILGVVPGFVVSKGLINLIQYPKLVPVAAVTAVGGTLLAHTLFQTEK